MPSRVHPGKFYALPQSPQQLKQLLMVAGFERYFQIARCFRDEDQRADRQPEFTQLDLEMSFVEREDILQLIEELFIGAGASRLTDKRVLHKPFPRLTYHEAMDRYGSDKPDLRFGMELIDLSDLVAESAFRVFSGAVAAGGQVKAIVAPGCADYTRGADRRADRAGQRAGRQGAGLDRRAAPTACARRSAKFLSEAEVAGILSAHGGHTRATCS